MTLIVVGLDLSLTATGMACISDGEVHLDRARSTGKKGDNLSTRQVRLNGLFQSIMRFVSHDDEEWPDLVVIESPSYASQHGSQHDRAGLWWMVVDCLHELEVPVATVSPNGRAKYGTGKGNSKKADVLAAARRTYFEHSIVDDNVADALLLAAMGMRHLGHPVEKLELAPEQLSALSGAAWPEGLPT